MVNRPKFYALTTVLALTGLAAAGCSSSSSSSSSSTGTSAVSTSSPSASSSVNLSSVTLNIGDQKGTGAEAVLTAAGLLSTLPFHVNWSDFTSGPPMLEAMASGSVDIGGVGDAPPVFAASGGEQVEIVGARETNGDQDAVVVPKNSPITSIQQLKGKKIAYGSGSSGNYNLLTVLTKAGLTTKDVSLVNLQPAEALAAFTSGDVAAWDIWPPYVQQVVAQDGARVLATGSAYGSPYSFEVASKAAVSNPDKGRRDQGLPGHAGQGLHLGGDPPVGLGHGLGQGGRAAEQHHGRGREDRRHHAPSRSPAPPSRPSRTWSTSSTRPG